jgi:phospholipase C
MRQSDRRTFLKLMGVPAVAAVFPESIARALAIDGNDRTKSIADVEHVVFLMQENRSFDHYFGTMRGVRGFADPRAVRLPSGNPVWYQPAGAGVLLPYRPDVADLGATFLRDLPHGWTDQHAAWHQGNYDRWVSSKGVGTMTYHTRQDLPYYFALADAFTICDAYHCSVLGPTDPNRYHMWTGWVGNSGSGVPPEGPVVDNAEVGYNWSTYPERLDRAGISWKVYQDVGLGLTADEFWGWTSDPYIGNYGDNSLLYFLQYQTALPGSPLANGAKIGTNIALQGDSPLGLLDIFRADVTSGRLPQVSWIVAPEAYTEHPNWAPIYGAWYTSQFLDILTSNPEVFSKTVLFVTWDENDGFFDHMVPPTPPQSRAQGLSTVNTVNEIFPGSSSYAAGPYGLGVRVPMIVVSPWSKGGWVNSQVFDHTSLIRFLEARFARNAPELVETNITPWRRTVTGDLTSAFDFTRPKKGPAVLPGTEADQPTVFVRYRDFVPVPPADQSLPGQERGVRPARALPYALNATGGPSSGGMFAIEFENSGQAGAVFQVRSGNSADVPRTYTVEPHKRLTDTWGASLIGPFNYDLAVYGPNGFFRSFRGGLPENGRADVSVRAVYDEDENGITILLSNKATEKVDVSMLDTYTGKILEITLEPGGSKSKSNSLARTSGWYDFVVTVASDPGFETRVAGHVETGDDSTSDPAMGGLVSV